MFTRVVETEQGTANVVAEHKDESILQVIHATQYMNNFSSEIANSVKEILDKHL